MSNSRTLGPSILSSPFQDARLSACAAQSPEVSAAVRLYLAWEKCSGEEVLLQAVEGLVRRVESQHAELVRLAAENAIPARVLVVRGDKP